MASVLVVCGFAMIVLFFISAWGDVSFPPLRYRLSRAQNVPLTSNGTARYILRVDSYSFQGPVVSSLSLLATHELITEMTSPDPFPEFRDEKK